MGMRSAQGVRIREYGEADLPLLRRRVGELHDELRRLEPALPRSRRVVDHYFDYLIANMRQSHGTIFVAEARGTIVGYLCLFGRLAPVEPNEDMPAHALIADLYVRPAYRNRGLGSVLMQHAEQHARTLGVRRIGLRVLAKNGHAAALYRRLGYFDWSCELFKDLD